jgi:ABC-2 type transport system ATP-binding protein
VTLPGRHAVNEASALSEASVLCARGVSKRFGERLALRDVSFSVVPGELVALIGANGAGKTTLLSVLAGAQSATAGSITGWSSAVGRRPGATVGWVPQQPAVYNKLTVAENLRLFARLERVPDVQATVTRMLAQTDLAQRAHDQVGSLSGGNRQRVNIAVGMLSEPAALLLDEPSAALDPIQRERLWEFVRALARQGTCVIFSTHNVVEAEHYATRALVLDEGELLFDGPPAQIAAQGGEGFEAAFVAFLRSRRTR